MWLRRTKLFLCLPASLLLACGAAWAQEETEEAEGLQLEIVRLDLMDRFAKYPLAEDSIFTPGEVVNVAFNLTGYEVSEVYRMKVNWSIKTTGPGDIPFAPGKAGGFDEELAPEDDDWQPLVRFAAPLPYHLPAGVYKIAVEAQDELSGVKVAKELDIRVAGEGAIQSAALTVQNFTFSLTAGGTPLRQAVYRPGGAIYASFDITGYQLGEGNAYELTSRLQLLDEEGATVYEFDPAAEKGAPFYPRLSIPASFQFNLDRTIEPGPYTLSLTVTDVIGRQTFSLQEPFDVR